MPSPRSALLRHGPGPLRSARPVRAALAAAAAALLLAVSGCTAPSSVGGTTGGGTASPSTAPPVVATAAPIVPTGPEAVLAFPATGAGAVGIASPDGSVQLLGQGGTTATVPIASITKVITSLVVLDAHPLAAPAADGSADQGPTITLGQPDLDLTAAIEQTGQFTEPMEAGQEVTLHDALAITLLTSANNYAESTAIWAFGSTEAYLGAARDWLAEHDLTGTTLADASGLDPGSASTTADLLRVAALAHANPALAAIAGLASYDQPDLGTIANQNILLGENGVDGLKTGSTSYAGFTLLTSARVTLDAGTGTGTGTGTDTDTAAGTDGGTGAAPLPVTLVSVVLGTESLDARFDTTRALLASARSGLRAITLATAGQSFGTYTTADGAVVDAVAATDLVAPVFGATPITAGVTLDPLERGAEGDPAGSVVFTAGSAAYRVPLLLSAAIG